MKEEIKEILEEMIDNEKLINVENDYEIIIFEYLANNCSEFDDEHIKQLVNLKVKQYKQLLNCITNLQERNNNLEEDFKRHIDRINELTERSDNLQEENKKLKQSQIFIDTMDMEERYGQELYEDYLKEQLEDYKQRNEKTIEYIKENSAFMNDDEWEVFNKKDLLNILKGDKDE